MNCLWTGTLHPSTSLVASPKLALLTIAHRFNLSRIGTLPLYLMKNIQCSICPRHRQCRYQPRDQQQQGTSSNFVDTRSVLPTVTFHWNKLPSIEATSVQTILTDRATKKVDKYSDPWFFQYDPRPISQVHWNPKVFPSPNTLPAGWIGK